LYFETISSKYDNFVVNIRDYFSQKENTLLFDRRNVIKIINYESNSYVVKSFKVPHIINKIAYSFFRESKARKSYVNSVRIEKYVPKAIGYIEFKEFGLLSNSYFISEEFKYDFTIREPLIESDFSDKENIFKAFAKFTLALHNDGIFHKDYSPGNILIKKNGDNYEFKIVDVNRMVFKELSYDERLDNFSKLWAKDEDLVVMIQEYAKLAQIESDAAVAKALKFSQALKDRKNLKKRLKGREVVD